MNLVFIRIQFFFYFGGHHDLQISIGMNFMGGYNRKAAGIDGNYAIVNIDIIVFAFFCNGRFIFSKL